MVGFGVGFWIVGMSVLAYGRTGEIVSGPGIVAVALFAAAAMFLGFAAVATPSDAEAAG